MATRARILNARALRRRPTEADDFERKATSTERDVERNATLPPVEPADDDIPAGSGDQAGADVTSRLLLALTALYMQRSNHTAEEQRQFTELVLGLIDKAGPAARAAVAARLRNHPDAPDAVVSRLGAGVPESHSVAGEAVGESIEDGGADDEEPPSPNIQTVPPDPDPESDPAIADLLLPDQNGAGGDAAGRAEETPESKSASQEPIPAAAAEGALTVEYGQAFFAASSAERMRMLSEISREGATKAAGGGGRRFHVRIDSAPWHGRTGAFVRDFARLLDAPESLCERILNDPAGEPMVVAARATGMPAAMLQRILLLASPAAYHSVQRVYELTELFHALDAGAARALLAAWRSGAAPAEATATEVTATEAIPVTNLRARFNALNARLQKQTVTSRPGPGNAGRRDPPSR